MKGVPGLAWQKTQEKLGPRRQKGSPEQIIWPQMESTQVQTKGSPWIRR